jgi:hypothetical protein
MRGRSRAAAQGPLIVAEYLLAITDAALPARLRTHRRLHEVVLDGVRAVCQRRTRVPPVSDEVLLAQHEIVLDVARHVSAILPARFGTLLSKDALLSLLRAHRDELCRALDDVRDRVQMTTRILGFAAERPQSAARSGREYLEERRRISRPDLPPHVDAFLAAVRPLAVDERREPGAAGLLATIYHLVNRQDVSSFERHARAVAADDIMVTGPWPPFAFVPQLL